MTRRDSTPPTADDGTDWREIADELAAAVVLADYMDRFGADQANNALRRYEQARGL